MCTGTRPWSPATRDASGLCLPALGRKWGLLLGPGDGMGQGHLGESAHRLQGLPGCGGMPRAPQKHRRNWLGNSMAEEGPCAPGHCPVSCHSACTMLRGFLSPGTDLRLSGALELPGGPQLGGDPVSVACWVLVYFSVWKGSSQQARSTARETTGLRAALLGCGVHLREIAGAMGGDCIRGCTSIWP